MTLDMQTFFENDFPASLFPLKTNLLMMRHHAAGLRAHIARILSTADADRDLIFPTQTKCHAAKPRNHLRRTAVLDPVATFFVYDFVFRNRALFKRVARTDRRAFGYCFDSDAPIPVHKAFEDFSCEVAKAELLFGHSLSFDVASYFNSVYHHDLAHWLLGVPSLAAEDANAMSQFLRETNKGRSIDCLPQGIYPTKLIGSAFLDFVESNGLLRCAQTFRFMDDIYLFDDDKEVLIKDFVLIQKLLGQVALNVNPTKTSYDRSASSVDSELSDIQSQLDSIIDDDEPRNKYFGSGGEEDWGLDEDEDEDEDSEDGESSDDDEHPTTLTSDQTTRLFDLLLDPRAEEADVERILGVLLEDIDTLIDAVPLLLRRFPNIVKQLHKVVSLIDDKESLAKGLLEMLRASDTHLLEYQLFWATVIAEDHLAATSHFGAIVMRLYELTTDSEIARAKVLEIPDQRFGLKEIRDGILMTGASNWLAWASAMGTRSLPKAARNHTLKYFAKGSAINQLIANCVSSLP